MRRKAKLVAAVEMLRLLNIQILMKLFQKTNTKLKTSLYLYIKVRPVEAHATQLSGA